MMRKAISIVILIAFIGTSVRSPAYAQVDPMPFMPKPGVMVPLSPEFSPAYLKGIVIHPENALKFDFIIYKGDKELTDAQKREEYTKLTKYFLASLAIPDDDQWVNLSPYEKDRIIKDDFGKTEMGRDLLAQDYMLKQITASLIYPEDSLGKKFWDKVYTEAQKQYGTTDIPVNTFNKVWILPDDALIYEKGNTAYILKNHLRVMLEEDYLSLQKHSGIQSIPANNKTHTIASKVVREIVLPELEREVNEDKNFATVRQVYSGMLLATWYKRALKESLLNRIYTNKSKVKGVDQDPKTNEMIYRQYLKAYKKGVFNFIKDDVDKYTNETIPRKYFSGGLAGYSPRTAEELGKKYGDLVRIEHSTTDAESKGMLTSLKQNRFVVAAVEAYENGLARLVESRVAALSSTAPLEASVQSPSQQVQSSAATLKREMLGNISNFSDMWADVKRNVEIVRNTTTDAVTREAASKSAMRNIVIIKKAIAQGDFKRFPEAGSLLDLIKGYYSDSLSSMSPEIQEKVDGLFVSLAKSVGSAAMSTDDVARDAIDKIHELDGFKRMSREISDFGNDLGEKLRTEESLVGRANDLISFVLDHARKTFDTATEDKVLGIEKEFRQQLTDVSSAMTHQDTNTIRDIETMLGSIQNPETRLVYQNNGVGLNPVNGHEPDSHQRVAMLLWRGSKEELDSPEVKRIIKLGRFYVSQMPFHPVFGHLVVRSITLKGEEGAGVIVYYLNEKNRILTTSDYDGPLFSLELMLKNAHNTIVDFDEKQTKANVKVWASSFEQSQIHMNGDLISRIIPLINKEKLSDIAKIIGPAQQAVLERVISEINGSEFPGFTPDGVTAARKALPVIRQIRDQLDENEAMITVKLQSQGNKEKIDDNDLLKLTDRKDLALENYPGVSQDTQVLYRNQFMYGQRNYLLLLRAGRQAGLLKFLRQPFDRGDLRKLRDALAVTPHWEEIERSLNAFGIVQGNDTYTALFDLYHGPDVSLHAEIFTALRWLLEGVDFYPNQTADKPVVDENQKTLQIFAESIAGEIRQGGIVRDLRKVPGADVTEKSRIAYRAVWRHQEIYFNQAGQITMPEASSQGLEQTIIEVNGSGVIRSTSPTHPNVANAIEQYNKEESNLVLPQQITDFRNILGAMPKDLTISHQLDTVRTTLDQISSRDELRQLVVVVRSHIEASFILAAKPIVPGSDLELRVREMNDLIQELGSSAVMTGNNQTPGPSLKERALAQIPVSSLSPEDKVNVRSEIEGMSDAELKHVAIGLKEEDWSKGNQVREDYLLDFPVDDYYLNPDLAKRIFPQNELKEKYNITLEIFSPEYSIQSLKTRGRVATALLNFKNWAVDFVKRQRNKVNLAIVLIPAVTALTQATMAANAAMNTSDSADKIIDEIRALPWYTGLSAEDRSNLGDRLRTMGDPFVRAYYLIDEARQHDGTVKQMSEFEARLGELGKDHAMLTNEYQQFLTTIPVTELTLRSELVKHNTTLSQLRILNFLPPNKPIFDQDKSRNLVFFNGTLAYEDINLILRDRNPHAFPAASPGDEFVTTQEDLGKLSTEKFNLLREAIRNFNHGFDAITSFFGLNSSWTHFGVLFATVSTSWTLSNPSNLLSTSDHQRPAPIVHQVGQEPSPVGGIDFNSANLNLKIRRDGKGVPLPLDQQDMASLSNLEGLEPVILEIRPATSLPFFSQLQAAPTPAST